MVQAAQKLILHVAIFLVAHLLTLVSATEKHTKKIIHECSDYKILQPSPKLSLQIILHAILLWASMGFLMPIAVLVIRMKTQEENGRRLKMIVYAHAALQRLGLALYVAIWLPLVAGIFRPDRGTKYRGVWYAFHWLIGVTVTLLGIVAVYLGLQAYNTKTRRSIRVWNWLFSAEVAVIAFIYLLQEKWHYIKQSGGILSKDSVRPTDQEASPTQKKELAPMS
ncbi:cytochrome b561 domain-containing protein At4g18260 isoform X2 [Capsicum annuum]|uniref:cytochrome b561 domain-containing protein At4g18260 isoform X2 n=1 Tax=Capsicum annuum TaxID=4072 RepID=UPI001FB0B417|nr:cytochrome b561 domain-containing protein At4g18260 isoform X2 [Capsicum annuum]